MELHEKQTWLVSILGARAAWTVKQNKPPTFDAERWRMQEWLTGVDQPHLSSQPAEQGLLVKHNNVGEEASTGETPQTTHHMGQADRDTISEQAGSEQATGTTDSDTMGVPPRAGEPHRKRRTKSSNNNKTNNNKTH
jgi:hypothetical protein